MNIKLADDYELRKVDALNWRLFKRKALESGKRKGEVDWVGLPAYFGRLDAALAYMIDNAMLDGDESVTLDEALGRLERLKRQVVACAVEFGELR